MLSELERVYLTYSPRQTGGCSGKAELPVKEKGEIGFFAEQSVAMDQGGFYDMAMNAGDGTPDSRKRATEK